MAKPPAELLLSCLFTLTQCIYCVELLYSLIYVCTSQHSVAITMTELSREIGEVWSRLFDHRPFLNGEIKFLLKEFEEKRGDREVENLFNILENITDIKDTQVDKIHRIGSTALPVLSEKLQQALLLTEDIEKVYTDIQKDCAKKRLENKEKRKREWDQFIDDMNFKCQRIDNTFEEKEEELRDLYADLNHKLNITNK
ncbi:biogenesis of lysosome-related organelles complex 1 subunit 5 [Pieris brassicae]|uniref:biogenesis of lysosome-related organelles complex 1 subunit 5 n=1 Tax=Pieris brassicae TaxID=7116 RepID=UPI001E6604FA|nr:biogenesis of lysosome-related organelles complex 1 subunit 5 [Pieris brassicae]